MKKWINQCVKGGIVIALLACSQLTWASTVVPKVTIHHKQASSQQVQLELGTQNIGDDIVALEVSIVADNIDEVLSVDAKIENSYTTYQLSQIDTDKEKLVCYVVSNNKQVPLQLTEEDKLSIATFDLKTGGKLELDSNMFSIKLIKQGYLTASYENVEMVYSESGSNESDGNDSTNNESGSNGSDGNDSNNNESGSNGSGGNDSNNNESGSNGSGGNDSNNNESESNDSGDSEQDQNISLSDVEGHWANDAIKNMVKKGVIKGYVDGTFKPNASITRGEFAALLARTFKLERIGQNYPFIDVLEDKWYTDSIVALYELGITKGRQDSTFGVNEWITNEEICTMLNRTITVLQLKLVETNPSGITFTDNHQISSYAKQAVHALTKLGVVVGRPDGSFGPQASTIRAQVAVMLERLLKVVA